MFQRTRIKLTAWYLLIIMLISIGFSVVIYRVLSLEVQRFAIAQRFRFERNFIVRLNPPPTIFDLDLVNETKHRLLLTFIIINGGILVLSGGLGYFLAGRTLKPIQEMIDEQNRFISDSSHELRTPLTALKSAMEVSLRDKKFNLNDAKALIAENINDVNKLQSLSDSLLKLAQYQKSNNQLKFEKVPLENIIQKAINQVKPIASKKNISIESNLRDLEIEGDKYALFDLFVIFLDNAVKYSSKNKVIKVDSQLKDKTVNIIIKDQGIGIDPKDIPRIFDRFYRADSARSKNQSGGYGLGLSIAKKIVDNHHGSIAVDSQLNKGTIFTINLPLSHSANFQI